MKKNQSKNNIDNGKSELSSGRSESSTKRLFGDDDETQTSSEYLKDNTEVLFGGDPNIFDLDLKKFFNYIASQEQKYIDYNLLSNEILFPSGDVLNFFNNYCDLYSFWINVILNSNINDIK